MEGFIVDLFAAKARPGPRPGHFDNPEHGAAGSYLPRKDRLALPCQRLLGATEVARNVDDLQSAS